MAYTYLIKWSTYNKWYYGVRYAKKADPNDLWRVYFTSSVYVQEMRKKYGEPDIVRVRKIFESGNHNHDAKKAVEWETKFLTKTNAAANKNSLNRWNGGNVPSKYPFRRPEIMRKADAILRKKYGGRGSAVKSIKEKVYKTNQQRYGKFHTLHIDKVVKARKNKNVELFGVENPFQSKDFQDSLVNPMFNPEIKAKHKQIMEEKDWTDRNNKTAKTNLKRYGTVNPLNTEERLAERKKQNEARKISCPICNCCNKFNRKTFIKHAKDIHFINYHAASEIYKNHRIKLFYEIENPKTAHGIKCFLCSGERLMVKNMFLKHMSHEHNISYKKSSEYYDNEIKKS